MIDLKVIEVIERNRIQKGKGLQKKLPNLYRLNIEVNSQVDEEKEVFVPQNRNFDVCLKFFFTTKELKKILPRRQFESLCAV